jgi:hypothetical protein
MKFAVALALALTTSALAQEAAPISPAKKELHTVLVGKVPLKLVTPDGAERTDGKDKDRDAMLHASQPPTNRLLAFFDLTDGSGRSLYAVTMRKAENEQVGTKTLQSIMEQLKTQLSPQMLDQAKVSDTFDAISKAASKESERISGEASAVSVDAPQLLGFFAETPSRLGFSLKMKTSVGGQGSTIVSSALVTSLAGRMVYLYATGDLTSEEDRRWAEAAVVQWHSELTKLNPVVEGNAAQSLAYRAGRLMGSLFALIIAATVAYKFVGFLRRKLFGSKTA